MERKSSYYFNTCKYPKCDLAFASLDDLIEHVEGVHLDFSPNIICKLEEEKPEFLPMSYVLKHTRNIEQKSTQDISDKVLPIILQPNEFSQSNSNLKHFFPKRGKSNEIRKDFQNMLNLDKLPTDNKRTKYTLKSLKAKKKKLAPNNHSRLFNFQSYSMNNTNLPYPQNSVQFTKAQAISSFNKKENLNPTCLKPETSTLFTESNQSLRNTKFNYLHRSHLKDNSNVPNLLGKKFNNSHIAKEESSLVSPILLAGLTKGNNKINESNLKVPSRIIKPRKYSYENLGKIESKIEKISNKNKNIKNMPETIKPGLTRSTKSFENIESLINSIVGTPNTERET